MTGGNNVPRPGAAHDAPVKALQAAFRDTSRLTRLFTILSEPAPFALMLDRVLATLSELFAADIVVLVDPARSGTFSPLAAIGLPEDMIGLPMSGADDGYVTTAMTTRAPVVKTEVSLDPAVEPQFRELGTETAVWVPVVGSHSATGALILARCHPTPFAHADVALLVAMAHRIGLALEQTQRSVQLEQIVQSGRKTARTLDEASICTETVTMLPALAGADAAVLVLKDPGATPRAVAQFGLDSRWNNTWSRIAEHLLTNSSFASFKPFSTPDLHAAIETLPLELPADLPVRALLAVPIGREERLHGLLYAMRFSTAPFTPGTMQVAVLYAAQTSAALENAWLYRAVQDELAERTRTEHQLRESEERFKLALMGADLGMWDWNVVTGEVSFNDRWAEMLGYSRDTLESQVRTREKLIHPDDLAHVMEVLNAHLLGHTPYYETEHRFLTKAGGWVWVLDKGKVTHRDAQGCPLRFVGTCLDITESRQIQDDRLLIEQHKHQVWRAESLSRMAGGISHHFNNLLQAITGYLELALGEVPRENRARSFVAKAKEASRRASEISRLMLAYLGQVPGKTEPVDLAEAAKGVLPVFVPSLPKNVYLRSELPFRGPFIQADEVHIRQVLTNLVSNAIEAIGDREGEITVATGMMAAGEIEATRFFPLDWDPKAERYACLSVADTGCGMDAETRERIFDPFFTTKFTGRGLGMPVALGLVRSFGGAIAVESEPGRGTTFRLIFPILDQEILPSFLEESRVSTGLESPALVLVADDDPMIRGLAQAQLEELGYRVIEACDGVEAVDAFRAGKESISLVLLDLAMPRMDGWETLAALRRLRPDIPVVIASGYDEAQAMQGLRAEQPQAFLHKPYRIADLKLALDMAQKAVC